MTYIRKIIDVEQDGYKQRVKTIESDYPAVVDYAKFETGELVFHIRGGSLVPPMIATKLGGLEHYNQNLCLVERDGFVRVRDLFPAGVKGVRLVEDQDRDNRILYDTLLGIEQIPEEDIEELTDDFNIDSIEPTIDVITDEFVDLNSLQFGDIGPTVLTEGFKVKNIEANTIFPDPYIEVLPDIDLSAPENSEYWDLGDLRSMENGDLDAVYEQAIKELYSRNDDNEVSWNNDQLHALYTSDSSADYNEDYGGSDSSSSSDSLPSGDNSSSDSSGGSYD